MVDSKVKKKKFLTSWLVLRTRQAGKDNFQYVAPASAFSLMRNLLLKTSIDKLHFLQKNFFSSLRTVGNESLAPHLAELQEPERVLWYHHRGRLVLLRIRAKQMAGGWRFLSSWSNLSSPDLPNVSMHSRNNFSYLKENQLWSPNWCGQWLWKQRSQLLDQVPPDVWAKYLS